MEYGSVKQYRYRMRQATARGETAPLAVSCQSCAAEELICKECWPFEDRWGAMIDALSNTAGVMVRVSLRELVR